MFYFSNGKLTGNTSENESQIHMFAPIPDTRGTDDLKQLKSQLVRLGTPRSDVNVPHRLLLLQHFKGCLVHQEYIYLSVINLGLKFQFRLVTIIMYARGKFLWVTSERLYLATT